MARVSDTVNSLPWRNVVRSLQMKKILYTSPEEDIELMYPDWLDYWIKIMFKHIRVRTVEITRDTEVSHVVYDEALPIEPKKV